MKGETINNLKIFSSGLLAGAVILVSINQLSKHDFKKKNDDFKDEFSLPKFEESFTDEKNTKEMEKYSIEYYGGTIDIIDEEVKVYSFDKDGTFKIEHGEKIKVPVENTDYLLDEHVTELESDVYKTLKIKDNITSQYNKLINIKTFIKVFLTES